MRAHRVARRAIAIDVSIDAQSRVADHLYPPDLNAIAPLAANPEFS